MSASLDFILGLLDHDDRPCVSQEDWEGEHGAALRVWQENGFLARQPGFNHVAGCPYCDEGVPYHLGGRYLCNQCGSALDLRHLQLWPLDREAFLSWLAERLHLLGRVRQIDARLWQLGSFASGETVFECFFRRSGALSNAGENRLSAYRNALLLFGRDPPIEAKPFQGPTISLREVLRLEKSLTISDLAHLFAHRGTVRFDPGSGALWIGNVWQGEVPINSKEFYFLDYLARHLDRFVSYADLKYGVLHGSGSIDSSDEATFCHKLKRRIKEKRWIPTIDRLLATTNKGDGYRLRGHVGEP